jgi:4-amino-4-deoxy-L-arabinose transferase-like glycosyltransferase
MKERSRVLVLILLVLAVRITYLGVFHHRVYSGPSTLHEQAFVAQGLLEGKGLTTYAAPPSGTAPGDPDRLLDPRDYAVENPARIPYVKEVAGYGVLLAGLWKLTGTQTWLPAQILQLLLELAALLGLYALTRRFFGSRAAFWSGLLFAFLFHEARASVIPYKDIMLLYAMTAAVLCAARVFNGARRPALWFAGASAGAAAGFHFMPNVLLYPAALILALLAAGKINLRRAAAFLLIAAVVVGAAVLPYQLRVRSHKGEPGVAEPLFWYRFWLGNQVRSFYSTEEERFQDHIKTEMAATGLSLEGLCKKEFLAAVKADPLGYAARTARKPLFGTFLVYGNAGDGAYSTSWSAFRTAHPESGFKDYAKTHPLRILGMGLGTLSASLLFPLGLLAAIILIRRKRAATALFFLHVPLYFILLHMPFHYEARYLLGTLPGYLPLIGFLAAELAGKLKRTAPEGAAGGGDQKT